MNNASLFSPLNVERVQNFFHLFIVYYMTSRNATPTYLLCPSFIHTYHTCGSLLKHPASSSPTSIIHSYQQEKQKMFHSLISTSLFSLLLTIPTSAAACAKKAYLHATFPHRRDLHLHPRRRHTWRLLLLFRRQLHFWPIRLREEESRWRVHVLDCWQSGQQEQKYWTGCGRRL
jgi:hypothetical protein